MHDGVDPFHEASNNSKVCLILESPRYGLQPCQDRMRPLSFNEHAMRNKLQSTLDLVVAASQAKIGDAWSTVGHVHPIDQQQELVSLLGYPTATVRVLK